MTTTRAAGYAPAALRGYQEDFLRLIESRKSSEPDWLLELRHLGIAAFRERGFPTSRRGNEDWKYTNVGAIAQKPFRSQVAQMVDPKWVKGLLLPGCQSMVFVNGWFDAGLSSKTLKRAGVTVQPIGKALSSREGDLRGVLGTLLTPSEDGFTALNMALFCDGASISVGARKRPAEPLHLLFLQTAIPGSPDGAASTYPRIAVRLGELARATIVETHASLQGDRSYLSIPVAEVSLAAGASLQHYKLIDEAPQGFHVATAQIRQQRDSSFRSLSICFGGLIVRNTVRVLLSGPGAEARLDGLYVTSDNQHVDNHTFIDHASPRTSSNELFKGLLNDRSRAVFTGRVLVRRDSQQIESNQHNRNLLLSTTAQIDSRPQLEIFADNVKCTHGATAGQMSEADLFFLRSRGLGEQRARQLLAHAFAQEILDRIEITSLKRRVERLLSNSIPVSLS